MKAQRWEKQDPVENREQLPCCSHSGEQNTKGRETRIDPGEEGNNNSEEGCYGYQSKQ